MLQGEKILMLVILIQCCIGKENIFSQNVAKRDSITIDSNSAFSVTSDQIFIYASRSRNPFTVSSIDQKDIDRITEPTIEPLLNSIPGVWMQSGALNTNRISIRGVGYREPFATTGIKIYLDEIPLTNGVGESSIEDIHPLILSGIDIWRGPSSALWGSGLGGMIHLKSKIPSENIWNSRIQIGAYERVQVDQNISLRYGHDDQLTSTFHYQFLHDGGYRENNDYKKHSFTWMQQWMKSSKLTLGSFLHGIDLKAFIPSSINETAYNNTPSVAAPTWGAIKGNEDYTKWITGINLIYAHSKFLVYKGALFGTSFNSDEVRPFNVLDEGNTTYGMRHRISFNLKSKGHISIGMEYLRDKYRFSTFQTLQNGQAGAMLSDSKEKRNHLNTFIQSEIDINEKFLVFAGLHLSLNSLSNQNVEANFPVNVFPTAGVNFLISNQLAVSASVCRGYSNLSLDDLLNSAGAITPGIKPETGWSEEVALMWGNINETYSRISAYYMNIDNSIITLRIADDIFEKINQGRSIHKGIEFEYRITPFIPKLVIQGSYSFQSNKTPDKPTNNLLPGTPNHRTSTHISYDLMPNWNVNINHRYFSNVFLDDVNSKIGEGYQLVNFGMAYKIQLVKQGMLELSANVHNLLDTQYSPLFQINAPSPGGAQPRYYYPGKPRSFYFGVQFQHNLDGNKR